MNNEEKMTTEECVKLIKKFATNFNEQECTFYQKRHKEKDLQIDAYVWNEKDKIYVLKDGEEILQMEKILKFYLENRKNLTELLNKYYDRFDKEHVKELFEAKKLEEIMNEYENIPFKELEEKVATEILDIPDLLKSFSSKNYDDSGTFNCSPESYNCSPEKFIELHDLENAKIKEICKEGLSKIDIYKKKLKG